MGDDVENEYVEDAEILCDSRKSEWEDYNLSNELDITFRRGNHFKIISESTNRSLLGHKISKCLSSKSIKLLSSNYKSYV